MGVDLGNFDAMTVEPSEDMSPIPAGEYKAIIIDSIEKETKKKTGSYINLTFQVIDGEYKGRCIFHMLNLNNPNDIAVRIAEQNLSAICRAVGVTRPRNTEALQGIPHLVKVAVKPGDGNYGPKNEIKSWKNLREEKKEPVKPEPEPTQQTLGQQPETQQAGPWRRP